MTQPLVSIITPSYQQGQFIQQTIDSVLGQTYPHLEYIVMDGGSQDGTVDILKRYTDPRMTWTSEKDGGQTNAINKGWHRSKGDILAWLNSDDVYFPDTVASAVAYLEANQHIDWIYGVATFIEKDGSAGYFRYPTYAWSYQKLLDVGCYIMQPTVFLRRRVFEAMGDLDESLHFGMDYEYWLRIGQQHQAAFVPDVRAIVRIFQETKSRSGGLKRMQELQALLGKYGQTTLPQTLKPQWVEAWLDHMAERVEQADWRGFVRAVPSLWQYPATVPRTSAKWLMRRLLPAWVERSLRRHIVRTNKSHA
jgi:glycosyltransferase involved in cell wall biosynthesis